MEEEKYAIEDLFKAARYEPTAAQTLVHKDRIRKKLLAGADRSGKSLANAMEIIINWYLSDWENPDADPQLIWLLAQDYEGTRGEWNHLLEKFALLGVLAREPSKNIDPGRMELSKPPGTIIATKSGKHPEKIATLAPDAIAICEAAQLDYEIYLRSLGRLSEKDGFLTMAGSFEGQGGWYPEYFTQWQSYNEEGGKSYSLPMWSNLAIYPGGRENPKIKQLEIDLPKEIFDERCGGVPSVPSGRVIKQFSNKVHVGDYGFDRDLPVELAVDPGYAGAYAVEVIQKWGEQIVIVDELYLRGYTTKDIIGICKQKPWWDAKTGGAIDIAAKQHQATEAPIEIWRDEAGISFMMTKVAIEDGIDMLQTYLKPNPITGRPLILVNSKCKGFISECGGCKSPVDGGGTWMRDKNTLKPLDKNDHATKAMYYWLAAKFGFSGNKGGRIRKRHFKNHPSRKVFVQT